MTRTGALAINLGQSRIDGLLLGIRGGNPNELSAATNQIRGQGLATGDRVRATGVNDHIGNVPVFFMTSIVRAPAFVAATMAATRTKSGGKKAAGKKKTAVTKKAARKAVPTRKPRRKAKARSKR